MRRKSYGFLQTFEFSILRITYSESGSHWWIFLARLRSSFQVYRKKQSSLYFEMCARFAYVSSQMTQPLAIWQLAVELFKYLCIIELHVQIQQANHILKVSPFWKFTSLFAFIPLQNIMIWGCAVSASLEFSIGHQQDISFKPDRNKYSSWP